MVGVFSIAFNQRAFAFTAGRTDSQVGNSNNDDFESDITFLEEKHRADLPANKLLSTASWKWNRNILARQVGQILVSSIQTPS